MTQRLWDKGEDLDKAVHAFTVGNDPSIDLKLAYWDALASAAHATMLHEIGVLTEDELRQLLGELSDIAHDAEHGKFRIPDELEDCHTAIENRLTKTLGDVGKKIHTGRSRNDQVLVAMRLFLKLELLDLLDNLAELGATLENQAEHFGHKLFAGHTHFQPAMPASMKMWLGAFLEDVGSLLRSGQRVLDELDQNPLGVGSGFGVPLTLDRARTADLLGFRSVQRNPIHVQNSRGRVEWRFCNFAVDVGLTLEKLAWDCILYSSDEVGYIRIPAAFTTGSSIMPQKRNPDVIELLRARAGSLRGIRSELEQIITGLPSHYHRDFQLTKEPVIRASSILRESVPILARVIEGIEVCDQATQKSLTTEVLVTYDVYRQVREEGVAFRDAYTITAERYKEKDVDISSLTKDFSVIAEMIDAEFDEVSGELSAASEAVRKRRLGFNEIVQKVFRED